jgi:hypothetical protein
MRKKKDTRKCIAWLLESVEIERNEKEKRNTKMLVMFRRGHQAQTAELSRR